MTDHHLNRVDPTRYDWVCPVKGQKSLTRFYKKGKMSCHHFFCVSTSHARRYFSGASCLHRNVLHVNTSIVQTGFDSLAFSLLPSIVLMLAANDPGGNNRASAAFLRLIYQWPCFSRGKLNTVRALSVIDSDKPSVSWPTS